MTIRDNVNAKIASLQAEKRARASGLPWFEVGDGERLRHFAAPSSEVAEGLARARAVRRVRVIVEVVL